MIEKAAYVSWKFQQSERDGLKRQVLFPPCRENPSDTLCPPFMSASHVFHNTYAQIQSFILPVLILSIFN